MFKTLSRQVERGGGGEAGGVRGGMGKYSFRDINKILLIKVLKVKKGLNHLLLLMIF